MELAASACVLILICHSTCAFVAATADAQQNGLTPLELEHLSGDAECSSQGPGDACSSSWLQRHSTQITRARPEAGAHAPPGRPEDSRPVGLFAEPTTAEFEREGGNSSFCDTHTGATCWFSSCSSSLGPTQCVSHHCRCLPGFCAAKGSCRPNDPGSLTCPRQTSGTCRLLACSSFRGPTQCVGGECLCQVGYCSSDGGTCLRHYGEFRAGVIQVNSESPTFPGQHGQVQRALCISGGGSRSVGLALGALRALESLGLMRSVDAISGVSGGSWAAAIYVFAQLQPEELLGALTDPSELTMQQLRRSPPPLGDAVTRNVLPVAQGLFSSTSYEDLWVKTFAKALLEPFGLGDETSFMATPASIDRVLQDNPQLRREQFLVPMPGRPPNVVFSSTLLAPQGHFADGSNAVSLQVSPDWTGSPFYPNGSRVTYESTWSLSNRGQNPPLTVVVGGGLVETFAYGGQAPLQQDGGQAQIPLEAPPEPMSLARAVGLSSAAFASGLARVPLFSDTAEKLAPKTTYWPVLSARFPGRQEAAMRHRVGDGGILENSGLLAMLQRGASRIVWLVNTDVGLSDRVDFCSPDVLTEHVDMKGLVTNQLWDKFGFRSDGTNTEMPEFLNNNQVFSKDDFAPLVCELQRRRNSGKPATAVKRLRVQANTWWGIPGGREVHLLLVYNERCTDFERSLPTETREELAKGARGAFGNFPWLKTVFQNFGRFTSLTSEQVNLLAAQAEYAVRQDADLFRQLLE